MNTKLILKTIFMIAVLLLLVIMGMNNRQPVELSMTGTVLTAGRKKAS